jgi:hypothetical protein
VGAELALGDDDGAKAVLDIAAVTGRTMTAQGSLSL